MANKSGASRQAVSLPAGGGDVRGLGETFQPDLNAGTGNYRVPLDLLPGVRNFQPALALVYSTGAGQGPYGLGWALPIAAIKRRTFRGVPTYDDAHDAFLYAAGELVEVSPGRYRAAVEVGFERVARTAAGWEVSERSGVRHTFGTMPAARIQFDDAGRTHVFAWLLERSEDPAGNLITYHYLQDGPQRYLQEIRYAVYTVRLEYEPRPDPFGDCRAGFELRTALRCSRITLHAAPVGPAAIRAWRLEYAEAPLSRLSLLARVTYSGHDPETGDSASLPPLELSYTGFDPARRRCERFTSPVGAPPPGLDSPDLDLVDLEGRGLPGVLGVDNGQPRYWPNRGRLRWGPPYVLPRFPAAFSLGDDRVRLADMDGDGAVDVLVGRGPLSGYYVNNGRGGWDEFRHYARSPSLRFEEGELILADLDGDGLVDAVHAGRTGLQVYANRGPAGWEAPRLLPRGDPTTAPPDLSPDEPRVRLADMTGDGLLDVVRVASGRLEYWPARGNGRYLPGRVFAASPRFPYPFDPARVFFTDVNGDGLADVVYVGFDEVTYWINQSGNAFSPPRTIRYTPLAPRPELLRVADMNATGTAGLLWAGPSPDYRYLDFTGGVRPGLLERIDNHLGRTVTVSYSTAAEQARADEAEGRPWTSFLPFPLQVVTAVAVEDRVSGLRVVTRYRYHEGHFDGHRREFDGFARSEQIEEGDASMPTGVTVFHFHTEDSARRLEPDPDRRRALKRKLHRVEVYGRDGTPTESLSFRVEESTWAIRVEEVAPGGRPVLFPHVAETRITTSERTTGGRVEQRAFTYDAHGNVLTEDRRGEGGPGPALVLKTEVEYAVNPATGVVDRQTHIVERDAAGQLLNETRHYYDGPAFQGLPLGQVTKGLLTRTERLFLRQAEAAALYGVNAPDFAALGYQAGPDADGQAAWWLQQERHERDARGNVVRTRDGCGHVTTYAFDAHGLFATTVTDAGGATGTAEPDYRAARPRRLVNPNGGVTETRYDPLGRLSRLAAPGDTLALPTARFTYATAALPASRATEYRVQAGQPQVARVFEYLDGAGSVYQRRTEHDGNTFAVSGRLVANARGKTAAKLRPFFAAGGAFQPYPEDPATPRQEFTYDALGRPTGVVNPDGGRTRAVYGAWQTHFYDAGDTDLASPSLDTPRVEEYDAWQRLVAVREHETPALSHTTRYLLDPLGRLRQVTDARGHVLTRVTDDRLGRRLAVEHLDAGRHLLAPDAAGNLALQVDAAGQTVLRTYDNLNRLEQVTYGGAVRERYVYDQGVGANLVGRLARVIDPSGETAFSYDAGGRVLERSRTVPGLAAPLTCRYAYDRLGRVTRLTYPDGVAVDFEYYSGLLLRQVPGYVEGIDYDAAGVRSALRYANGVRTEYTYDPADTRLAEVRTWRPAGGEIYFHNRYHINKGGNVEGIDDLRAGPAAFDRTQDFVYDGLDRLTHAVGTAAAGPYAHDYAYDTVGNFLRNPQISPNPLVYAAGGASNRLTGHQVGGQPVSLFAYDANGNLTSTPAGVLSFDARQQLARVQLQNGTDVRFAYDHRGVLSRRELTSPAGNRTTHFLDNLYEVEGAAAVRWVFVGEVPVAREDAAGRIYIHNDHLASAVVYTNATGGLVAEAAYFPFGGLAVPPAAGAAPAFAAKRLDVELGLYYFNARWYAPSLGRFVSPDPLYLFHPEQGLQEPRRLNPYAYAGNNPLRLVDPSGLGFWDVLGAIVVAVALVAAVVAVSVLTFGVGTAIGFGTLALYAGAAGLVGAVAGAIVGGIAYGSWDGALRGALIGFTAGVNFMIGSMIFGPIVGGALGLINFLAVIPPVAKSDVYQGILGWSSYLMPMSWPGHAIGLVLFTLNVAGYLITFGQVDALRIRDMRVDWKTGNIFTVGGWVGGLDSRAFNFGAFSFVNPSRFVGGEIIAATFEHESGHMLSNAAFGIFQATRVFEGGGTDSFWERIAESNVPPGLRASDPVTPEPDRPRIPQWG